MSWLGVSNRSISPVGGGGGYTFAGVPQPAQVALFYGGSPQQAVQNVTTLAGLPCQTVLPQYNLLLLGQYFAVESIYGFTFQSLFAGLKATASNNGIAQKCFLYTNGMGAALNSTASWWDWLAQAQIAANMLAYTSLSGSGTTNALPYDGFPGAGWQQWTSFNVQQMPQVTISGNPVPADLVGLDVWHLYARYWTDSLVNGLGQSKYHEAHNLAADSSLDGIYYDNLSATLQAVGSSAANWMGFTNPLVQWPSTPNSGVVASAHQALQQGHANAVAAFKAINPNLMIIANGAASIQGTAGNPGLSRIYQSAGFDAWEAQYAFGASFALESFDNSPPGAFMQWLSYARTFCNPGGVIIFEAGGFPGGGVGKLGTAQSSWSAADWSGLRMMVAAGIIGDHWFAPNVVNGIGPANALLWDEMRQAANNNALAFNWLGTALDPPQLGPWATFTSANGNNVGIWRRRFINGVALWMPRQVNGNGNLDASDSVAVTNVGTGLFYCASQTPVGATMAYGDTTVNTGAAISSANGGTVTMQNYGYGAGLVLRQGT